MIKNRASLKMRRLNYYCKMDAYLILSLIEVIGYFENAENEN